jgi:DNA processing protein
MDQLKLWLHLLSTPELGRKKIRKLINLFGSPAEFIGSKKQLIDLDMLNDQQINHLSIYQEHKDWSKIIGLFTQFQIKYVTICDKNYPDYLATIFDPPVILFYRGELSCLSRNLCLAVVGTRRPSNYGKLITQKITKKLAAAGFTIVSGLAYGVDSTAHRACLEAGGKTAAVMATGPDLIYPPGNKALAERIIEKGIILSEYLPGSQAEVWCFPTRNRIISGLSKGCIIVEGSRQSGALLTAKFALDQNRDIFAVPGDITRAQSSGPNHLIRIGAKPVTAINDILEEYDLFLNKESEQLPELTAEEKKIFQIILKNKPEITFDKILLESGKDINTVSSLLLSMELKSVIKKMEANKYMIL